MRYTKSSSLIFIVVFEWMTAAPVDQRLDRVSLFELKKTEPFPIFSCPQMLQAESAPKRQTNPDKFSMSIRVLWVTQLPVSRSFCWL
jgi:hypothetical protein